MWDQKYVPQIMVLQGKGRGAVDMETVTGDFRRKLAAAAAGDVNGGTVPGETQEASAGVYYPLHMAAWLPVC